MKLSIKGVTYKSLVTLLMLTVIQVITFAQEGEGGSSTKSVNVTSSTTTTSSWYAQPWVWVVGAAVLILLLVALLRGGSRGASRTDRVTVTKTTDTDV